MSDIVLSVENVSKRFRIGAKPHVGTLREAISNAGWSAIRTPRRFFSRHAAAATRAGAMAEADPTEFWALRDVSFEVRRGEVLGIVGRNGAGKSTLLKIISRIMEPTTGRVGIRGRLGSLLEVGTGFHPELTGRENIFMNGRLLGMSRAEIRRKFDDIVDFSGVSKFIDTPVKRYSSGMTARLGFSVATHFDPELLIVDEVLAVGDFDFQRKCLAKIDALANNQSQRTIILVSHNAGAMRSACTRAVSLEAGRISHAGQTERTLTDYEKQFDREIPEGTAVIPVDDTLPMQITSASILDRSGAVAADLRMLEPASVLITYTVRQPVTGVNVSCVLNYRGSVLLGSFDTDEQPSLLEGRTPGEYETEVPLPVHILKPGNYTVTVNCGRLGIGPIHRLKDAFRFKIGEDQADADKSYAMARPMTVAIRAAWKTRLRTASPTGNVSGSPR